MTQPQKNPPNLSDPNNQNPIQQKPTQKLSQKQIATKKKRKTKHRKHPPQYYQQLKLTQMNKKRQEQWNNRFIMGTIPCEVQYQRKSFSVHQTNSKQSKRHSSPKEKGSIYKTTFQEQQKKQKSKGGFNTKTSPKKDILRCSSKDKKQDQTKNQQMKITIHKQHTKEETQKVQQQDKNKLIEEVSKAQNQYNFQKCHEEALIDIIKKSKQTPLKSYIYSVIERLKTNKNIDVSTQVEASITKRQETKQKIQQTKDEIPYEQIEQYRTATIKVIQQIIRWRDEMQIIYKHEYLKPKVNFIYQGVNYLTKICNDIKPDGSLKAFISNPFLLGFENKKINHDVFIKIRACQVFLLEELMFAES